MVKASVSSLLHTVTLLLILIFGLLLLLCVTPIAGYGQQSSREKAIATSNLNTTDLPMPNAGEPNAPSSPINPVIAAYFDPIQGASSIDLVRRALTANQELAATRLDIERSRARLQQAGLRPNPTIDLEQSSGQFTGSKGDRETSIGIALPLEIGGKRKRRMELAQAELAAAEAEIADRERRLMAEVRTAYAEALAALRELEFTDQLNTLDVQTTRIVDVRVKQGDAAPLELKLLQVEVDRLRSRQALIEGRLQAALLKLKSLVGITPDEALRLREDLASPLLSKPSGSLDEMIELALKTRPDLQLARLNELAAQAGLKLAQAQALPDVTIFSKYTFSRDVAELPAPLLAIPDRDRLLSAGVSISLPILNRNQGAKAEALTSITQAQRRRAFVEQMVRAEVASAYARYQAATQAVSLFEQGVIARSNENLRAIRGAYQLGSFRVTDLLAEQRCLVDSQREFTEALTEQYRALADLQSAIGLTKP